MLRGINQQQIVEDKEDNKKFIEISRKFKIISGYKLYAYCLTGNHLNPIIKVEKEQLEQIFKRVYGRHSTDIMQNIAGLDIYSKTDGNQSGESALKNYRKRIFR
jgi:hypothetical protein